MQISSEMTNSLKAKLKVFLHCINYFVISCYYFDVDDVSPKADLREFSHYKFKVNDIRRLANTV